MSLSAEQIAEKYYMTFINSVVQGAEMQMPHRI